MKTNKKFKTRDLTMIAMLGAICCVLMHVDFPLPFMPPFMNFDLCGLVELIGGFAMGPLQAFCIIMVKILLKLATEGTSSAFTGELQNVILSCAYVLPPVILYHRNKTKKTAMVGMAAGTLFCSIVAVFTNLFIIIPFYMALMGQEMSYFIAMCTEANPLVQNAASLAIFGIIPFNLIKCSINSLGAMVLYKRLSPLLHGYGYTTYPVAKVKEADA
ncbi:MAG: ECF transporter S component [Anaerotignum sp.]|nr:ECF transporter S component [Anaerotignum sp.]MBR6542823.1 ECF transporter S component [Anaerotignum sp.]